MRKLLIGLFICLTLPTLAIAQRGGNIRGAGTMTCGEFIDSRKIPGADSFYSQWSIGFLSYHNVLGKTRQVAIPDVPTVLLHAEKYCREHPLEKYHRAATALLDELGGNQP